MMTSAVITAKVPQKFRRPAILITGDCSRESADLGSHQLVAGADRGISGVYLCTRMYLVQVYLYPWRPTVGTGTYHNYLPNHTGMCTGTYLVS